MKLPGIMARAGGAAATAPPKPQQAGRPSLPHLLPTTGTAAGACESGKERVIGTCREDFEVLDLLGTGGFGEVKLVRCAFDQRLYAMKAIEKAALHERRHFGDHRAGDRALGERDIGVAARTWRCPFIVELCAAFQTPEKLYYIFEYMPGGELLALLGSQPGGCFSEDAARFYTAEVCLALEHLHQHGAIHRDVRLENMLLAADGHVKLGDMGCAKVFTDLTENRSSLALGQGSAWVFYPPEFRVEGLYGKDLDCWQLGVATFAMLSGRFPRLCGAAWPGDLPSKVSKTAVDFCCALLREDRKHRLGYAEGACQLRDQPFFAPLRWADVEAKAMPPPQLRRASEASADDDVNRESFSFGRVARATSSRGRGLVDLFRLRKFSFTNSILLRARTRMSGGESSRSSYSLPA